MGYAVAATPGTAAYYTFVGGIESSRITVLEKPREPKVDTDGRGEDDSGPQSRDRRSDSLRSLGESPTEMYMGAGADHQASQTHDGEQGLGQGQAGRPNALDWIRTQRVDLLVNIPEGSLRGDEVTAGYQMRRAAVDFGCSLLTNIKYAHFPCHCRVRFQ